MFAALARRRYRSGLAALERGDIDQLLSHFDPDCEFVFAGRSPLGSRLHSREALVRWFTHLHALLPEPRFEVKELVVTGWPWDQHLAARAVIHSSVAGEPYKNDFAQFLRLRWGRVVWDFVLEDTQRFERAVRRLAAAGVAAAAADPIQDAA